MQALNIKTLSQLLLCAVLLTVAIGNPPVQALEPQNSGQTVFKSQELWQGGLPTNLKQAEQDLKQLGILYKYYPPRKAPSSWLSFTHKDWEGTLYFGADFKTQMLLLKSPEFSDKTRFDQQLAAYLDKLGAPSSQREGYQNPIFKEQILLWPVRSGLQYKLNLHSYLQQENWQIWEARSLSTKN